MNKEYYDIVKDILNNEEFKKRKNYMHHGNTNVYDHSLNVSIMAYKIGKKLNMDVESICVGALLHDFYSTPWPERTEKTPFLKKNGFTHAKDALNNANMYFPELLNEKSENIILRHMFPLNVIPPKYKEGWLITILDKVESCEVLKDPKSWPKYLGFRRI